MKHRYNFPKIENITDVLPHIDENFVVKEADEGITYVNYVRMGPETFPEISHKAPDFMTYKARVRRELRGIAFDTETGQIVSRPFHKFFNVGEREGVTYEDFDLRFPHVIMEKLDGSMIRPIPTRDGIRWGTKMGITDVAMMAETFVADKPHYLELARAAMGGMFTPIFEYCGRDNRIVIDHPVARMPLLAIRHNTTGNYMSYDAVKDFGARYGVEVVGVDGSLKSISDIRGYVESLRQQTGIEGVVIDFGGHKVKSKTDEYLMFHRGKEMLHSERHLLGLVFEDAVDDVLPVIDQDSAARIVSYIGRFWKEMDRLVDDCFSEYVRIRRKYKTKKDFAIGEKYLAPWRRSLYFAIWDAKIESVREGVLNTVRRGLSNNKKFSGMKLHMLWNAKWEGEDEHEE